MWAAAPEAAASGQPVMLLYVGQAITLLVAAVTGWFALRTRRVDVDDARRARFDARVDKELDDALTETARQRALYEAEHSTRLRYERYLIRAGIDPDTGLREGDGDGRAP